MTTATLTKPKPAAPLAHSMALAGADLKQVDALILDCVKGEIPLIRDITKHIVASGGKRLRPLLTVLSARACGYRNGARHIGLAAAVEFIHTATLLHDDVVDESKLRRGLPTANETFGNKASILVGDFLFAKAFQLMVADGVIDSLRILSDASAIITQGEVKQLMTEGDPETSEATYLDVVNSKTAALFSAACEIGAVVSEKPQLAAALREYGTQIGIAFQLVDDALDYGADQNTLGKTVGDDFREGKVTLPVLLAYARGDDQERIFWHRTISEHDQKEGDFNHALAILQRQQALTDTFARAKTYAEAAAKAASTLPESPERQALLEIVDFCVERMY